LELGGDETDAHVRLLTRLGALEWSESSTWGAQRACQSLGAAIIRGLK